MATVPAVTFVDGLLLDPEIQENVNGYIVQLWIGCDKSNSPVIWAAEDNDDFSKLLSGIKAHKSFNEFRGNLCLYAADRSDPDIDDKLVLDPKVVTEVGLWLHQFNESKPWVCVLSVYISL